MIKRNPRHQHERVNITAKCKFCNEKVIIRDIDVHDYIAWQEGEIIQNVLHYLTDDEREILATGTCGKCFDKMVPDEEE